MSSADWVDFDEFYLAVLQNGTLFEQSGSAPHVPEGAEDSIAFVEDWVCTGPITFRGQAALDREIAMLKDALGDRPASDAFLTTTAPLSVEPGRAERVLQVRRGAHLHDRRGDAGRVRGDRRGRVPGAGRRRLARRAVGPDRARDGDRRVPQVLPDALRSAENHALRNIPEEQIRYHLCWGSWHGPHSRDLPLPDVIDILLSVKAQTYLIEAANVRHEHEVSLWEDTKLPDGKILAPGVVTHSTPLIEHPQLVADRIQRFAALVGRENVIASTDCGLGLRCHPQIAWAKLKTLSDGAALATTALWR